MVNEFTPRIAVIGCGAVFDAFYLKALKKLSDNGEVNVVALVDSNRDYIKRYLKYFPSSRAFASMDADFSNLKVSRSLVLTPPSTHAEILEKLASMNSHVYCEKPLTISTAEAITVRETFSKANLLCKVGYVRRVFPNFQVFKTNYSKLGSDRLLSITDGEVFRWPIKMDSIFMPEQVGGGIIWDKLSHNLDLIQWIDGIKSIDKVISNCVEGQVPVDVLVEGQTNTGCFKIAASWTESFPNMVKASDGENILLSNNGIDSTLKSNLDIDENSKTLFDVTTYEEAVEASLREFLKLSKVDEKSILASVEESVSLTKHLSVIEASVKGIRS